MASMASGFGDHIWSSPYWKGKAKKTPPSAARVKSRQKRKVISAIKRGALQQHDLDLIRQYFGIDLNMDDYPPSDDDSDPDLDNDDDQAAADASGDQADAYGDQADAYGDQADASGDQADASGDQAQSPPPAVVAAVGASGDQADAYGDQADAYGDQAQSPPPAVVAAVGASGAASGAAAVVPAPTHGCPKCSAPASKKAHNLACPHRRHGKKCPGCKGAVPRYKCRQTLRLTANHSG
jgi:hypothetical protein